MIEIEMSKDIRDFKPKLVGFLDARQLICFVIASIYGFPLTSFLLQTVKMDISEALTIVIVAVSPPIACGYIKLYGMYLDVFLVKSIIPMYLSPGKRTYKTKNTLEYLDPEKIKVEPDPKNIKLPKRTKKEAEKYKKDLIQYNAKI